MATIRKWNDNPQIEKKCKSHTSDKSLMSKIYILKNSLLDNKKINNSI